VTPFVILSLPRSRSFWLSRFLTYGDYRCGHDEALRMRSGEDVRTWLAQDFTGSAETGAARWWRLIRHYRPDARIVVVRRPVEDVLDSIVRIDLSGVVTLNRAALEAGLRKKDRALDIVERCAPGVLSVAFDDLRSEDTCARVFEHCLPYRHDPAHWRALAGQNLQTCFRATVRYQLAHLQQIGRTASIATKLIRQNRRPYERHYDDGVVVREEPFATFWRDAEPLLMDHLELVGEDRAAYRGKNIYLMQYLEDTAAWQTVTDRSNGRMLGYLLSTNGPSLTSPGMVSNSQAPLFVSRDAAKLNIGARLQAASIQIARNRRADEVLFRAGVRGSGPRLGVLYERYGAEPEEEPVGRMYRLRLKERSVG
jgi:GNAT superfamily N-acetyltransferase